MLARYVSILWPHAFRTKHANLRDSGCGTAIYNKNDFVCIDRGATINRRNIEIEPELL
jgi:hypothetical protein